jgi:hypothetical protein
MDLQDADNGNTEPEENVLDPNEPYPVVISPFYFVLLSVATFGLYLVWWQYKCWQYFKEKENSNSVPVLWTLLYFIWGVSLIPLLYKIRLYCKYNGQRVRFDPIGNWLAVLAINVASYFFYSKAPLLSVFTFLPFLLPVMDLNYYFTGNYKGYVGDKLNSRQIILLVLGAFGWATIIQAMLSGNYPPPLPDFFKMPA